MALHSSRTLLRFIVLLWATKASLCAQHLEVETLPAVVGSSVTIRPVDRAGGPMPGLQVTVVDPQGAREILASDEQETAGAQASFRFVPRVVGLHTFETELPREIPEAWSGHVGLARAAGCRLVTPVHVVAASARWLWIALLTPLGAALLWLHARRLLSKRASRHGLGSTPQ